jgi:diamine N-acetyltransferase
MSIRQATKADVERIADLSMEVHDIHVAHWPTVFKPAGHEDVAAYFAGLLEAPDVHVFVACRGSEIVGYTVLVVRERLENAFTYNRRWLYVEQIGVTEAHRRQGHAAGLIEAVRAVAKEQKLDRIELDTYGFNERAQAFFRSQGFQTQLVKMGMDV